GYYLVTGLGVIILWITAFTVDEPARDVVALAGAVLLGAYALVFARRLAGPPVEGPRLLRSLPFSPAEVAGAKRLAVAGRAFLTILVAGAPTVARAAVPLPLGIALAVGFVAVVAIGSGPSRVSLASAYGRPTILWSCSDSRQRGWRATSSTVRPRCSAYRLSMQGWAKKAPNSMRS